MCGSMVGSPSSAQVLHISSSESKLPVFGAKGHLFGMNQCGFHEAATTRSSRWSPLR
jgi:hypothetical protein